MQTKSDLISILGIIIMLSLCFLMGLLKYDLTNIFFSSSESREFVRAFSVIDFIFGFATPILLYAFFVITTYIMLIITDNNKSIKPYAKFLPIGFLPPFFSTVLAYVVLTSIDYNDYVLLSQNIISNAEVKGVWSISLRTVKTLTTISYFFIYVYTYYIIDKFYKTNTITNLIITLLPSLIVMILIQIF